MEDATEVRMPPRLYDDDGDIMLGDIGDESLRRPPGNTHKDLSGPHNTVDLSLSKITVESIDCSINKIVSLITSFTLHVHRYWKYFARCIGTPSELVGKLDMDIKLYKISVEDAIAELVEGWVAREGSTATLESLVRALQESNLFDCAKAIRKEFNMQKVESSMKGTDISSPFANTHMQFTFGKLTFDPSNVLGKGSGGAIVYHGTFEQRPVAVKRFPLDKFPDSDRERTFLQVADHHPNVMRIFGSEIDPGNEFRYVALTLCESTLKDWVEGTYEAEWIDGIAMLKDVCKGLTHLHSKNIAHLNVNPGCIFLRKESSNPEKHVAVIGGLKFGRTTAPDEISYSEEYVRYNCSGWGAPELFHISTDGTNKYKLSTAADVFSLGCIFYYVLTKKQVGKGYHPYGDPKKRIENIQLNNLDVSHLSNDSTGADKLIKMMLLKNPEKRPTSEAAMKHPVLWNKEKMHSFFLDIHYRIAGKRADKFPPLQRYIEDGGITVGSEWKSQISDLKGQLVQKIKRGSSNNSVRDLLKLMSHFLATSTGDNASIHSSPYSVYYWMQKFRSLVPCTWECFEKLKEEIKFKKYYHSDFDFDVYLNVPDYSGFHKFDAHLRNLVEKGENELEVIITFKDKVKAVLDELRLKEFATIADRRKAILDSLEEHSAKCQKNAMKILDDNSVIYESQCMNNIYATNVPVAILLELSRLDEVDSIEENILIDCSSGNSIEEYNDSAGDNKVDWCLKMINVDQVRQTTGNTGKGNVIGIFDTGVYGGHASLQGNRRRTHNWFDPYGKSNEPQDKDGHGTHVASIAVGKGTYGVAPDAKWIACLALGKPNRQGGVGEFNSCGKWIMSPTNPDGSERNHLMAPDVVCCAWTRERGIPFFDQWIAAWQDAGIVPVFPMGNTGPERGSIRYPAADERVISVGSVDINKTIANDSSRGLIAKCVKPNVVAPGYHHHHFFNLLLKFDNVPIFFM